MLLSPNERSFEIIARNDEGHSVEHLYVTTDCRDNDLPEPGHYRDHQSFTMEANRSPALRVIESECPVKDVLDLGGEIEVRDLVPCFRLSYHAEDVFDTQGKAFSLTELQALAHEHRDTLVDNSDFDADDARLLAEWVCVTLVKDKQLSFPARVLLREIQDYVLTFTGGEEYDSSVVARWPELIEAAALANTAYQSNQ